MVVFFSKFTTSLPFCILLIFYHLDLITYLHSHVQFEYITFHLHFSHHLLYVPKWEILFSKKMPMFSYCIIAGDSISWDVTFPMTSCIAIYRETVPWPLLTQAIHLYDNMLTFGFVEYTISSPQCGMCHDVR